MKNSIRKLTSIILVFTMFCSLAFSNAATYSTVNGQHYSETVVVSKFDQSSSNSGVSTRNTFPNDVKTIIRAYDGGKVELIVTNTGIDSVDTYNVNVTINGTKNLVNIVHLRIGTTKKKWNVPMTNIRDRLVVEGSTADGTWRIPIYLEHERYDFVGGQYGTMKALGGERHHCPAAAILPSNLSAYKAPAIRMLVEDHRQTLSCGYSNEAKLFRAQQAKYIAEGKFLAAQKLEIDDVKAKFPGKYDAAISQMIAYTKTLGYTK